MDEKDCWFVYIIETESGMLYTGITKDLKKRFSAHSSKSTGARFFRTSPPKEILYAEVFGNRSEATKREAKIKKLRKEEKLKLIRNWSINSL